MNYEFEITITKQIATQIGLNIPTVNEDNESYDFFNECVSFTIANKVDDVASKQVYYYLDMPFEVDLLLDHDSKNEDILNDYIENEFPEQ